MPTKKSTESEEKAINSVKSTPKKAVEKKTTVKKAAVKKTPVKKSSKKKIATKKIVQKSEKSNELAAKAKDIEPKKTDLKDDFDWNEFEEGIQTIDSKQIKEFDKLIDENFVDTYNDNVIIGEVLNITEREAIIDINAKSEGVISLNEFRYNPELKVGDKVEVIAVSYTHLRAHETG